MTPPVHDLSGLTDAELVAAHLKGDPSAFGEIFLRHRDRIWAVSVRTLGNPADAADVLQETFIKAMRSAGSFRGDSAVTTWLHRIAVNTCLDHLRASSRRPTDELVTDDSETSHPQPDRYAQRDTEIVVRSALAQIPEDQRVAIVLIDIEGLSVSQAAEILGIAEGTVKSRCSRGRSRLASLLSSLAPQASGNPARTPGVPSSERKRPAGPAGPAGKGGTR